MALSLAACGTQKRETLELFAMDTYMTFVAIGDGADDVLTDLSRTVNTLESSLSRTVDTSEVSRLNRDGSAVWDEDGAQLLSWALQHSQETDGAFDITIAPLVELWGITSDSPRVPSQAEIDALLPLVGYEHVHQSEFCNISLDEGCSVDLGGIAKGYASDCAAVLFHRSALTGGCANLGGNVYVYGTNAQNKPWSVAIQDPADSEGYVCTLSLSDAFVVTSGGYQRYFTAPDGTVYQHILDPKTGYPVQSASPTSHGAASAGRAPVPTPTPPPCTLWASRPPWTSGAPRACPLTWCSSPGTAAWSIPPAWLTVSTKRTEPPMSTNSSPPELKWNRFDALVALAVVLLAIVSALCFYLPKNQSGALTVVIDISGQEVRRVPLSDFTETTVTSRGYTLHIATEGGAVSVTDSDCPTRDCVHTGAISRAGQSIVCLPAQVVVHLEGASAPDAPDVIVG